MEYSKDKQNIIAVIDKLENEITRLTKLLEEEIPVPMKMSDKKVDLGGYVIYKSNYETVTLTSSVRLFQHKPYHGDWQYLKTVVELDSRKESILRLIAQYEADLRILFESAETLVQHNKIVHSKITQLMSKIGVTEVYQVYDYETTRSKTKKWIRKQSGFVADLNREAPTYNEYKGYTEKVKVLKALAETEYTKALTAIHKTEREEAVKKTAAENVHKLALLRAKYTPENAFACADDILDSVMSKDKYLRLAHFLEANRGDWNGGYDYAEQGLNGFNVETPEDQEIYDCIYNITQYEDVDGRYFRDCEYNYSMLFGKADESLYKDYLIIKEVCD